MRFLFIKTPSEAVHQLKKVGVDTYGIEAMVTKMNSINLFLEGVECKVANILKQEMLSVGGDVAVSRGSVDCSVDRTDAIIIGTVKQQRQLAEKITVQPFGLKNIAQTIQILLDNFVRTTFLLTTPEREITLGEKTLVMGIVNATPDSFSDGGMFRNVDEAVEYGLTLEDEGANILDIGGESTRPGSEPVSAEEEMSRILPLLRVLRRQLTIPISVDTTKAVVARAAIAEGAEIINDISALRFDENMTEVAVSAGVPVIMMHMRGTPKIMQEGNLAYDSLIGEIIQFFDEEMSTAQSRGLKKENIVIDPGVGFGKSYEDNLRLIRHLEEFKTLGMPICIGTSRKGFVGATTGGEPQERLEGTAATVTAAIMNGAHIVRVHDVESIKKVTLMADAIARVSG